MPILKNAWIAAQTQDPATGAISNSPHSLATDPVPVEAVEVVEAVEPLETINVNTANLTQLRRLSGIGEASARRIIAARSQQPFEDVTDLVERAELGHITDIENLEAEIAF